MAAKNKPKMDKAAFFAQKTSKQKKPPEREQDGADEGVEVQTSDTENETQTGNEGPITESRMKSLLETLNTSLLHQFKELIPEVDPDLLVIDRIHRVGRPKHIPISSPRDVLMRIHYFHVKDQIMKASRKNRPLAEYKALQIYADLSPATLLQRRNLAPITTTLRAQNVPYRWGFPTKIQVLKN
ncbi:Hypothetical predicted protein [Pelobates cultripes]|uniref:Uncharacterized protein n=1 Tax=Pelobates cultripes TaxID=61616 RepID=A0AAD1RZF4_PELCU|nr:Hypothetical predicted protein [Pelobates cultripes]